MQTATYRRLVELCWFWLYPAGMLTFVYQRYTTNFGSAVALFMVLAPALTMYVVVGTGAGLLRFWYFTTGYSPRGVMLTIGFLYSAVLSPFGLLLSDYLPHEPLLFIGGVATGAALLGTFVDVFLLQTGLLYVKSKQYPPGSNPVRHALSYGPLFFGFVGLINAIGLTTGYRLLTTAQPSGTTATLLLTVAACTIPFLIFLGVQKWRLVHHYQAKQRLSARS